MEEKLLTREEAAKILGVRPNTMAVWKSKGVPSPASYKINGLVRYKESDLMAFIESNRIEATQ